jgi:hypothetical protein
MPGCRFYLMNQGDHIIGVRQGSYVGQQDAEHCALEILNSAHGSVNAVEGWDQARLICRVIRNCSNNKSAARPIVS